MAMGRLSTTHALAKRGSHLARALEWIEADEPPWRKPAGLFRAVASEVDVCFRSLAAESRPATIGQLRSWLLRAHLGHRRVAFASPKADLAFGS
jgi:hypothetical protein